MNREQITLSALSRLNEQRDDILSQWNNPEGTPTRHFYVDNFLPDGIAQEAYDAFPKNGEGFYDRETFREKKRTSANLSAHPQILADITYAVQDKRVVDFIAGLVGFTEIEPDRALYAGGLSMMFKGDFLNPHLDNSHDAKRDRYRRLNVLYYVPPNWKLENGGNLELWDNERLHPKTIISAQNRLVVMETNKSSWHSVSPVLADHPRCCVSNYYFSKISPDDTEYFHVTSFTGRPEEKVKRMIGHIDNGARNLVSKLFNTGRGKDEVNKDEA